MKPCSRCARTPQPNAEMATIVILSAQAGGVFFVPLQVAQDGLALAETSPAAQEMLGQAVALAFAGALERLPQRIEESAYAHVAEAVYELGQRVMPASIPVSPELAAALSAADEALKAREREELDRVFEETDREMGGGE